MHPIIIGVISTFIVICGLAWQFYLFEKDATTNFVRVSFTGALSILIVVGAIGYTIFAAIDPKVSLGFTGSLGLIWTSVLISLLVFVKQYLGPLFLGVSLAWATYMGLQHGEFQLIPYLQTAAAWLFSNAPDWAASTYLTVSFIYSAISAIGGSALTDGP
jgi:hypothetical protein